MRQFLRHLRAAWRFGVEFPYAPEADEHWSALDAQATQAFYQSTTGKRLGLRLRNHATRTALEACMKNDAHMGAIAAGISMTAAFIDSHAMSLEQEEESNKIIGMT